MSIWLESLPNDNYIVYGLTTGIQSFQLVIHSFRLDFQQICKPVSLITGLTQWLEIEPSNLDSLRVTMTNQKNVWCLHLLWIKGHNLIHLSKVYYYQEQCSITYITVCACHVTILCIKLLNCLVDCDTQVFCLINNAYHRSTPKTDQGFECASQFQTERGTNDKVGLKFSFIFLFQLIQYNFLPMWPSHTCASHRNISVVCESFS